jgi:hypothetical protein
VLKNNGKYFKYFYRKVQCILIQMYEWFFCPKVVGSISTVVRHIFQACPVWIYTQSNITSIRCMSVEKYRNPQKKRRVLRRTLARWCFYTH